MKLSSGSLLSEDKFHSLPTLPLAQLSLRGPVAQTRLPGPASPCSSFVCPVLIPSPEPLPRTPSSPVSFIHLFCKKISFEHQPRARHSTTENKKEGFLPSRNFQSSRARNTHMNIELHMVVSVIKENMSASREK